jgi:hypothetical protein
MKITQLLLVGLIAFIVFRLTQSVQDPPSREPEPGRRVFDLLQTSAGPARSPGPDSAELPEPDRRRDTNAAIITLLQRLIAATPAPTQRPSVASNDDLRGEPSAPAPAPIAFFPAKPAAADAPQLTPRERLRISEARRPMLKKQYGEPQYYKGLLRRHMPDGTILMGTSEVGDCLVEDYEAAERLPDGAQIGCYAWATGTRSYTSSEGKARSVLYLVHIGPPLPIWDEYGRPINRDVLPPETVRDVGLHSATMLDRYPKKR